MLRLALAFALMAPLTLLAADLYPCRDRTGHLFVTDNPANLPAGCVLLENPPSSKGSLSVVESPAPAGPSPAERGAMSALSREEQQRQQAYAGFSQEAKRLVDRYEEILPQRYQAMPAAEGRDLIRQIKEIKEEKRALAEQVGASRLGQSEQREILDILARIPSD